MQQRPRQIVPSWRPISPWHSQQANPLSLFRCTSPKSHWKSDSSVAVSPLNCPILAPYLFLPELTGLHSVLLSWCVPQSCLESLTAVLQSVAAASPLNGPIMAPYLSLAQSTGMWLSLGGFQELYPPDPKKLQNCHVIVDSSGKIVSMYRKVHLFDVEVFNGPVLKETSFTAPGQEVCSNST